MQIIRVNDWNLEHVISLGVDVFICTSGYERRSTYLFGLIGASVPRRTLVLGSDESNPHSSRIESDAVFAQSGARVALISGEREAEIFTLLREAVPRFDKVRIMVDYSSMPRKWINAIVNYFKFCDAHLEAEIFFCYTPGRHVDRDVVPEYPDSDYQVTSIESLTTLEGAAVRQRRTMAVVGLGFEWVAPFAACELMEPDEVRCFFGNPGSLPGYGKRALELNARFLQEFCRDEKPLGLPVRSVESVYRNLGELVAPALLLKNVAIIPLGPKPHILGCILISNRLKDVSCIYVKGGRDKPQRVEAVVDVSPVVTRVHMGNAVDLAHYEDFEGLDQ